MKYEIPGLRPCHDSGVSSPVTLIRRLWRSDDILEQETIMFVIFMYKEGENFFSSVQKIYIYILAILLEILEKRN